MLASAIRTDLLRAIPALRPSPRSPAGATIGPGDRAYGRGSCDAVATMRLALDEPRHGDLIGGRGPPDRVQRRDEPSDGRGAHSPARSAPHAASRAASSRGPGPLRL